MPSQTHFCETCCRRSGFIVAHLYLVPFIMQKSVGDEGVDVVIEMLANVNLSNDLKLLSRGGRVIVSTVPHGFEFPAVGSIHSSFHCGPRVFMTGCWLSRHYWDKPKGHHGKGDEHHWSFSLFIHQGTEGGGSDVANLNTGKFVYRQIDSTSSCWAWSPT